MTVNKNEAVSYCYVSLIAHTWLAAWLVSDEKISPCLLALALITCFRFDSPSSLAHDWENTVFDCKCKEKIQ